MLALLGVSFAILLLVGMPVAFAMGASSVLALVLSGSFIPLEVVPQRMFVMVDSFPLMAIPFFILAGEAMERGGISLRMIRFATALVGHWRGGLAQVDVVGSMIFSGISGSSVADASAIGSIMEPAMIRKGYPRGFAAAIEAASAAIGPIIPPSIIMIIYGSITGVSIGALFLAGVVPGFLIGAGLMFVTWLYALRFGWKGEPRNSLYQVWLAFLDSFWALLAPFIIIGGIIFGVFTATEAGVVAVVYALFVALFVYREIGLRDLRGIFLRAALTTATVMIIIAAAGIFGWLLAIEQVPQHAVGVIRGITENPIFVLFLVLALVLLVGCFVDVTAAAIMLIPVLYPLGPQFGFDPIHFALVLCMAFVIGGITPPIGILLYVTMSIARASMRESVYYLWPYLAIEIVVLIAMALLPGAVLFLPRLVLG
jgi:tripartite ATP-independent transporter DctM subunit